MRRKLMLASLVTVIAFGFFGALTKGLEVDNAVVEEYVCPPCGCGNDDKVHDKAGYCSVCGMQLVLKGSAAAQAPPTGPPPNRKKAAILIFDGVQIIDYTGPYEVFGQAGMEVFTVAAKPETITTAMNMKVTPHYTLENAPAADVLLIPGGGRHPYPGRPECDQVDSGQVETGGIRGFGLQRRLHPGEDRPA